MKNYDKQGDTSTVVGDLTLRNVTKEVIFVGSFTAVTNDPWGAARAGFRAEGKLNHKDFSMVWSKTPDNGGLIVGDEGRIRREIECIKAKYP